MTTKICSKCGQLPLDTKDTVYIHTSILWRKVLWVRPMGMRRKKPIRNATEPPEIGGSSFYSSGLFFLTAYLEVTTFMPSSNSTRMEFILPRAMTRQGRPFRSGNLDFQNQL